MRKPRDYIDAKFTVVGDEPPKSESAFAVSAEEWAAWSILQRLIYSVLTVAWLIGLALTGRWLYAHLLLLFSG